MSLSNSRPWHMNHQCSTLWLDVQKCRFSCSAAVRSSPSTSRQGPFSAAFQCDSSLLYIWKPS